jgi:general secretion pathway protein F
MSASARKRPSGDRQTSSPEPARRDVQQLLMQLSDLLAAGCPLSRSLEAIGRQASREPLRALAEAMHADIQNGSSLAGAIQRRGRSFSKVQAAMIRAAEEGGFLQETLASLAADAARQIDATKQVRSKMAYPALLVVAVIASAVFLMAYVVPKFARIYTASDARLPLATELLLNLSALLRDYWILALLGLTALAVGTHLAMRSPAARRRMDGLLLQLPVIGPAVRDWQTYRFARTLALLLGGGVTALRALRLTRDVASNSYVRGEIDRLADAVERGDQIGGTMRTGKFFDATTIEMIVVSEATGRLSAVLESLADQRYRDFQTRLDMLLSLMEPVIILLMGGVVGLTVMALLLPVVKMSSLVG